MNILPFLPLMRSRSINSINFVLIHDGDVIIYLNLLSIIPSMALSNRLETSSPSLRLDVIIEKSVYWRAVVSL